MGDVEMDAGGEAMEAEGSQVSIGVPLELLEKARQQLSQAKPSFALQNVFRAIRLLGGEQAAIEAILRAREACRNALQGDRNVDELCSTFAECLISEAQPVKSHRAPPTSISPMALSESSESSILAMSGRKQIMFDAFSDGSSFICLKCGGLVSNLRKDEHLAYWCG